MSKIKVTFVETNCKKNGPIKQTLNIIRNMDKEVFEPSLVTVWPEDADNSMIDEYKKLGIPVLSANMSKKKSVLFGKKEVGKRKTSDASNDVLLRFDANSNMLHFRDLAWSELFLFASSFDFRIYNNRLFEKNIEKFSKSILYDS